jgi:3-phenylpropionate/trans-cinnamate dioxygenase ferredoxin reductase component
VTIVSEEPVRPYKRPPLTKQLLQGKVASADILIEPPTWLQANEVALSLGQGAVAVDPDHGTVTLRMGASSERKRSSWPPDRSRHAPTFPGADSPLTMRRLPDCLAVRERATGRSVTIGGGGFIASGAAASWQSAAPRRR